MMCNTCTFREWLYNLKGVGVMVVFQKNILIPNVAKKMILILVEEIFFIWFRQKKFLNETKNHNHPPSSKMVGSLVETWFSYFWRNVTLLYKAID